MDVRVGLALGGGGARGMAHLGVLKVNAHGVQPDDVVIEPDVSAYDLTEFMRSKEVAAIGEAAALEQIPKIKQLLARLDPQLFRPGLTDST